MRVKNLGVGVLVAFTMIAASPYSKRAGNVEVKDPNPPSGNSVGVPNRATGGPDAFGYLFADTFEALCSYQMVTLNAGTLVGDGDDVCHTITLSQPFQFYGNSYTQLDVCTNGFISTQIGGGSGGDLSNDCPLPASPSTGSGARMYVIHDDLVLDGGSAIETQFFNVCPRQNSVTGVDEPCTVVQWKGVRHFGDTTQFKMQAILYHNSGGIAYMWDNNNPEQGSGSTTGIQDSTATIGLTYACNTPGSLAPNSGVCFYRDPNAPLVSLTLTESATTVPVNGQVTYTVTASNTGGGAATDSNLTLTYDPAVLSYVGDTCGGSDAGGTWNWFIGDIPAGGAVSCDIIYTLTACANPNVTAELTGSNFLTQNASGTPLNSAIVDGSFEAGTPNPNWNEFSTNFGTPICETATCGTGGGTAGPRTGNFWAWFGGIDTLEEGTLSQNVTLASGGVATLKFWLWTGVGSGNGTDFFEVNVDGNQVFQALENDPTYSGGYTEVSVDLSAYADGGTHTIELHSIINPPAGQVTNFSVDDVELYSCQVATIGPPNYLDIPTVSTSGLVLLVVFFAAMGAWLLRR